MQKSFSTVVFLLICPLLVAQQPEPVPSGQDMNAQAAPAQAPAQDMLLDGTPVKLRISQTISSEEAKTGQEVPFEVLEDVNVAGLPVIKKGDTAFGVVTEAQSKRMMGRAGKLNLSISYVRLSDQEKIPLTASKNSKGKGSGVGMGVGIAASAVLFFPAAPFFLLMHGKDVTIPQGTEITAFVAGDARVNLANFGGTPAAPAYAPAPGYAPAPAPAPAPAYAPVAEPPAPPAAAQVAIAIESTPPGADIEIDGGFVGNTPSTITVAAGSHQIAVKKKGFADWTRTLNVTSGDIHLNAQLEAAAAQ